MSTYSIGVSLEKISNGTLAGLPYTMLVTNPLFPEASLAIDDPYSHAGPPLRPPLPDGTVRSPVGQLIMSVRLPAKSQVHIAGFSVNDKSLHDLLGNTGLDNLLTRVKLEGNFPDYFKLYCTKGREIELRQVLDPSRMEYLVDFCQRMNWELFEDNVYFVQSSVAVTQNGETIVQAAEEFAQKILPTLLEMTPPASAA